MSIFGPLYNGKNGVTRAHVNQAVKHEHILNVRALGRYIVWYDEAEDKQIYYSVRARKNIDLENGILLEIKNGNGNGEAFSEEETSLSHTRLESSKELYVMLFNDAINIPTISIGNSWNFILSAKPNNEQGTTVIKLSLRTDLPNSHEQNKSIFLQLPFDGSKIIFDYINYRNIHSRGDVELSSFYPVNSQQLIHLSIGCESNTISLRVNGKPWRDYKLNYNHKLTNISISAPAQIGILSIYNRQLSKPELIQHFIDYHVSNFTNDEVLI